MNIHNCDSSLLFSDNKFQVIRNFQIFSQPPHISWNFWCHTVVNNSRSVSKTFNSVSVNEIHSIFSINI